MSDSDSQNDTAREPARTSTLMAYCKLMRIGNVFTAFANIMMGYLVVQADLGITQITAENWQLLALLLVATFCLYSAGMVLNDVFDVQRDTAERNNRPIPAGQVSLAAARKLGWGLLAVGVVCGALAGSGSLWIALAVAVSVVLYDWILKQTPIAPIAMGLCRTFNILLGMSLADSPSAVWLGFAQHHLLIAGSVGVFVAGLTWFARTEARVSNRGLLTFGVLTMMAGLWGLAMFPRFVPADGMLRLSTDTATMLIALLGILTLTRCVVAIADPVPAKVQAGVISCLKSLIFFDASVILIVSDRNLAIATLALLLPMLIIGKKIRAT